MITRQLMKVAALGVSLFAFVSVAGAQLAQPGGNAPRNPGRAELEQRIRERTAQIVQRRLALTDDEMRRLAAVNSQFDSQRMALMNDERQARQALRSELMAGNNANQQKVASALDDLMKLQHRRLDLVENEQRELAKFMTPVQRAKYFALQTELRRRMQELRDRRMEGQGRMMRPGMQRRGGIR